MDSPPVARQSKRRCEWEGPAAKAARGSSSGSPDVAMHLAAMEKAAAGLEACVAGDANALNADVARRLGQIGSKVFSLRSAFEAMRKAKQEAAAAQPLDLLDGAVSLPAELIEAICYQLPPKSMAAAASVTSHFQQAVRRATPARIRSLGLSPSFWELRLKVSPLGAQCVLLEQYEREVKTAPGLLERAEPGDLHTLRSYSPSVLHTFLDDERMLTLLKGNGQRAEMAWRLIGKVQPTAAWAVRNKSVIGAGLQASGIGTREAQLVLYSASSLLKLWPVPVLEENLELIAAALPRLLRIEGMRPVRRSSGLLPCDGPCECLAKLSPSSLARIRTQLEACLGQCQALGSSGTGYPSALKVFQKVQALLQKADRASE